jgi:hypothetical protein
MKKNKREVDNWIVVVVIFLAALLIANLFVSASIFSSIAGINDEDVMFGVHPGEPTAIERFRMVEGYGGRPIFIETPSGNNLPDECGDTGEEYILGRIEKAHAMTGTASGTYLPGDNWDRASSRVAQLAKSKCEDNFIQNLIGMQFPIGVNPYPTNYCPPPGEKCTTWGACEEIPESTLMVRDLTFTNPSIPVPGTIDEQNCHESPDELSGTTLATITCTAKCWGTIKQRLGCYECPN